jgi:hypothetical protein
VRGTCADIRTHGARPVAFGALFVFGGAADRFAASEHAPLEAIARVNYDLWLPADCPHCRAGLAFENVSDAPAPPPPSRVA